MSPTERQTRRTFLQATTATVGLALVDTSSAATHSQCDITCISATQLASQITKRKVGCVEVVKAYLNQIDKVNQKINAIVQLRADAALKEAHQADQDLLQGRIRGPLHGVPFTLKDNIETSGIITTCGMPELANYVPKTDATVASRLKGAGGILLGKTNVPEFCMFPDTKNLIYGRTKNPYDRTCITEGSSGGEAAILAACGSAFGIGTDIGSSIRSPSHHCGIAGLKPTSGRVPDTGVLNCFPPFAWRWNATGPMARYVEDLALVLKVISGPDGRDPYVVDMPLQTLPVKIKKLRVAYFLDDGNSQPADEIRSSVKKCSNQLRDMGARVTEIRPPGFEEAPDLWWFGMTPDIATTFRQWMKEYAKMANTQVSEKHLPITELFLKWQDYLVAEGHYTETQRFTTGIKLHQFRSRMLTFMNDYDVILCPVTSGPATPFSDSLDNIPPLSDMYEEIIRKGGNYCSAFNLTGWPAASVPVSQSAEGLPIGVQIAAKPWREDMVLGVASILETAFGGWRPPRGI